MKFWDCFLKSVITQSVVVLIIVLTVVVLRFGFVETFKTVKEWYQQNVLVDTDIYEVIK